MVVITKISIHGANLRFRQPELHLVLLILYFPNSVMNTIIFHRVSVMMPSNVMNFKFKITQVIETLLFN